MAIPGGTTYLTFDSNQSSGALLGRTAWRPVPAEPTTCAPFHPAGTSGLTAVNGTGGISGLIAPVGAMLHVGVFLGPSQPASAPPPNYYSSFSYFADAPQLGQLFYVGTGRERASGRNRKIVVPEGAESVYFGYAMAPPTSIEDTNLVVISGDPGWYAANTHNWTTPPCPSNISTSGPIAGDVEFETGRPVPTVGARSRS